MGEMTILGVKVDAITKNEAIAKIASFLDTQIQHFITTPNPEIVLYAHGHADYRAILNKADLALPDGAGLVLASRLMGQPFKERVSGTDMIPEIAKLAREKGLRIALLGGLDQGTIEKAAKTIRGWGNAVVYADYGVSKEHWNDRSFHEKIVSEIRAKEPQIVFAGFGHPKQEQWIDSFRSELPSVRLFLGCGGALDFVSGAMKRAPRFMRQTGLEWLWRLIKEPRRAKRILNAVIVFPLTVLYDNLRKK
jgi:N-acetylglucosaminyldiphosphoundecaprenol N-acetyl-beta-D-mannosaminyltransferase